MKNFAWMGLVLCALLALSGCTSPHEGYRIEEGVLVFDTPPREPGQQSVLGLAVEPIPVVRVGFIGLGMRGPGAVERFTHLDSVRIVALCDLYPERVASAQRILAERGLPAAAEYSGEEGWKELCRRDDIDLVYICTPWQLHVPMAVYAMEQGKHVAVEVPAATSLEECWQLVNTAEKRQRHCMMLENCVYDFFELTTLNMAQHGLFGELLEAEGAYIHNLEPFWDYYQGNWRLEFNRTHRGDVYATHGLGPVCQLFDIHRGDRMRYLVAMDTPSVNGLKLAREKTGADSFANGDHTLTLIRTERGRVIHLQHNVYTPRPYSRMYSVTGSEGYASKYPVEGYAFRPAQLSGAGVPDLENLSEHAFLPDAAREALMRRYEHPIAAEIAGKAKQVGGHGGMDFIMDYRLVYCLRHGLPLDQDVYDAAEWSCIGALTAASLERNSMPVAVPDFTRGDWNKVDGYRHAMAR
ncbi:MAG TPA: Gfo/Idh/MocA family oxidoreductase [Candidatus Alistipes excrementigallinarum]|jgi:predicted dehydrogenase|uniref:Gfo/Idh/MocA family protein n=1 Tax=Alistipes sp. TaxID=1872444 RepID=UPI001F97FF82|nr:Gfo/Idh/MocA family oxidoreductase [Candidatus Alistipes excrementigallinarum]